MRKEKVDYIMKELIEMLFLQYRCSLHLKLLEIKFFINLSESGKTPLPTIRDVQ